MPCVRRVRLVRALALARALPRRTPPRHEGMHHQYTSMDGGGSPSRGAKGATLAALARGAAGSDTPSAPLIAAAEADGAGAGAGFVRYNPTASRRWHAAAAADEPAAPQQPNEACRRLFGASTPTAPIDAGFPTHTPFEHGELDVRVGTDALDFNAVQRPLSAGDSLAGYAIIAAAAASGVGLAYLAAKTTLVQEGCVALVQSYDGRMRVLPRGLYLKATVGTSVVKARLTSDVIQHGLVKIIRVLPGHVGLCTDNGKPALLLTGRHLIVDALFEYHGDRELTDNHIQIGTAHIITVPSDQVGLASVASVAHFLGPGRHAFNNPVFSFVGFKAATDPHVVLHSKHRIYVPRGQLALATLDVEPLMLQPGVHNYDSPRFTFLRLAAATEPYLAVGSKHRLFLPAGSVALVIDDGRGAIVEEAGVSEYNSPTFEFKGMRPATDAFLRVGAAARVLVNAGFFGKVTIDGTARLLPPGVHRFTEPNLTYDGAVAATDVAITYGNIKRLLVPQGTWYITYDDGNLVCLPPGAHTLEKPTHAVAGPLTAGMTVLSLKGVRSMTADNVQLLFDAALSVRVQDPVKAVTMLCGGAFSWQTLQETVLRKADLVLNSSIGQHRLNQAFAATSRSVAPAPAVFDTDRLLDTPQAGPSAATAPSAAAAKALGGSAADDPFDMGNTGRYGGGGGGADAGSFKEQIHRIFMREFSETMLHECGVEIISMTIEGVNIVDADLAKVMAQGAVARAQLVAATVENEAMQKAATAKAAAARITAEGAAAATVVAAQAEATAITTKAAAEAQRIAAVSAAMGAATPAMVQREMLDAAGGVLAAMDGNGSRLFVGPDPVAAVMAMLGGGVASALTQRGKAQ
jgi:regulator of protease activity HflC (stomatin/prohibitin superfamily)